MAFKTVSHIDYPETDVGTNPAANTQRLYFKTDHKLYKRDSGGSEIEIGAASSGAWAEATTSTSDGTETSLFTVTIAADNTTCIVKCIVVALKTDGTKRLSAEITYSAYRDGAGAIELMGTNILASNAWDAAVFTKCEFDCSGNDIRLRIAGVAATDINWKASYITIQQAGI